MATLWGRFSQQSSHFVACRDSRELASRSIRLKVRGLRGLPGITLCFDNPPELVCPGSESKATVSVGLCLLTRAFDWISLPCHEQLRPEPR